MAGRFGKGLASAGTRTKTARSYKLYRISYTDYADPATYNVRGKSATLHGV